MKSACRSSWCAPCEGGGVAFLSVFVLSLLFLVVHCLCSSWLRLLFVWVLACCGLPPTLSTMRRYKMDLGEEHMELIREVLRKHRHHQIGPEIRRELDFAAEQQQKKSDVAMH